MSSRKRPLVELKRKDDSSYIGAIAIVDQPAIESNFYMFADQKKEYYFVSEPKKMIAGLALIPDKQIYRQREVDGITYEFDVFFKADTIRELRNDFMKNKRNDAVNFMHVENAVPEDVYLVETFIVDSKQQQDDLKKRFKIDAPIGSWFVQMHVENLELFNKIKEVGFKGFSIEGIFDEELVDMQQIINNNNKNNNMMNRIIEKFKAVLAEFEAEEMVDRIAETGQEVKVGAVGEPVMIITNDSESPAPNGTHVLESGDSIEVLDGLLVARIPKAEEMQEEEEEPVEEPAPVVEELPIVDEPVAVVEDKPLKEIVDISTDGDYEIKVVVKDGAIQEAVVDVEQVLKRKEKMASQENKIKELEAEVTKLKAQLKAPVTKPVVNQKDQKFTKEELAKMTPYERTALAKGFKVIK